MTPDPRIPQPGARARARTEKLGSATVRMHYSKGQIHANICDSADLCGRTTCRFYNTSREATRLFMRAQAEEHSLDALMRRLNPH